MKKLMFLISILGSIVFSCTKEKTHYESEMEKPIVEEQGFKEVVLIAEGPYVIRLSALNGQLYTGFNDLRLSIELQATGEKIFPTVLTFLPVYIDELEDMSSCPHLDTWNRTNKVEGYFSGYAVFNRVTSSSTRLNLYVSFKVDDELYTIKQAVDVEQQRNKNLGMTEFVGKDGELYYLALISPQQPKVGENALVAGLYKYNKPTKGMAHMEFPNPELFSYSPVDNYTLLLDPRMPDPSMGNHSSPNNKDLKQGEDGFYHGMVNYTMTGNWALNFIMLNAKGQIQRGTVVPPDFTPGVEGVRSELFIDILF